MDGLVYDTEKTERDRPCGLVNDATCGRWQACGHVEAGNNNYTPQSTIARYSRGRLVGGESVRVVYPYNGMTI